MTKGKTETRRQTAIPATSTLAQFVRRGHEGTCIACDQPVRAHYGHRGTWLGCPGQKVPADATFVLVPVWGSLDARKVISRPTAAVADDGGKHAQDGAAVPRQHFVYAVKDKRKTIGEKFSEAVRDAYNGLRRAKSPQTAEGAAKLAKRPTEANRRALNVLARRGWVRKAATVAA